MNGIFDIIMLDKSKFVISQNSTILDALRQIDAISAGITKILFVSDEHNKVVGSVSDGDCRRALISGSTLDTKLSKIMFRKFKYLGKNKYDVNTVNKIRELGIKYVPELNEDGTLYKIHDFTNGKSFIPVDAVIMAGGLGERLRPMTLEKPKPLLEVAGKAIIDYNIENLIKYGIDNINVTVNYLAEQIEDHFRNPFDSVYVNCVREPNFLGTIGSVKFIKDWHNDTVLVMNSDLFTNINLESFYLHFKKHDAAMSVACVPYNVNIPYGIFELKNTREICGIKEKPNFYYYANAGIYLIKRELLDLIPKDKYYNSTDFLNDLIRQDKKVIRFPITGYWIDIGKPEDFKKVQEFAKNVENIYSILK